MTPHKRRKKSDEQETEGDQSTSSNVTEPIEIEANSDSSDESDFINIQGCERLSKTIQDLLELFNQNS